MVKKANTNKTFGFDISKHMRNDVETHASPEAKFALARSDPFNYQADGARTLDEYSFPTTTRRIEQRFNVTTDSNGSVGLVLLPNLSDVSAFTRSVTGTSGGSLTNATSAYFERAIAQNDLDGVVRNHRIVGWGAKVSWTQNVTAIQGTYTVAGVPGALTGIFSNALNNASTTVDRIEDIYIALGLPYVGSADLATLDTSSLAALPYATMAQPLCKGEDVYMVSKPTSAFATAFRQSDVRNIGTDATDVATAGTTNAARELSMHSKHGWECFAMGVVGATPSISIAEVTLVYHLEGTPRVTSGAIRDASISTSPVNPMAMVAVAQASSTLPSVSVGRESLVRDAGRFVVAHANAFRNSMATIAGLGAVAITKNPAMGATTYNVTRSLLGASSARNNASRMMQGGLLLKSS